MLNVHSRLCVPFVEPGGDVSVCAHAALAIVPWSLLAGLLRFPGLALRDRLGLLRVALEVRRRSRRAPPAAGDDLHDVSASSWLRALGPPGPADRRLWDPLGTAGLNAGPGP